MPASRRLAGAGDGRKLATVPRKGGVTKQTKAEPAAESERLTEPSSATGQGEDQRGLTPEA